MNFSVLTSSAMINCLTLTHRVTRVEQYKSSKKKIKMNINNKHYMHIHMYEYKPTNKRSHILQFCWQAIQIHLLIISFFNRWSDKIFNLNVLKGRFLYFFFNSEYNGNFDLLNFSFVFFFFFSLLTHTTPSNGFQG